MNKVTYIFGRQDFQDRREYIIRIIFFDTLGFEGADSTLFLITQVICKCCLIPKIRLYNLISNKIH